MSRSHGRTRRVSQRKEASWSFVSAVFAGSLLLPLFLPFPLQLPEFAPPQVIYSKDLIPLLLAPWASPGTMSRLFSHLLQSILLFRLPRDALLPCYLVWISIGLSRILVGFLLSRSVGWAYPRLFNHWALYESSSGCGPPLVTYLLASGVPPSLYVLFTRFENHQWEVTELLVLLVVCTLLIILDHSPWTYSIAIGFATLVVVLRSILAAFLPSQTTTYSQLGAADSHQESPLKRLRADIQIHLFLLVLVPLPSILSFFLPSPPTFQTPSPSKNGAPFLEILILSYPRSNDVPSSPDQHSILSQTIASYLPYASSSTALSVFTHASPSAHPAFMDAEQHFKDAPVTFHADKDTHPDAYEGQYLHLAEAFRWVAGKGAISSEWVMLVEDDFPVCGEWGWAGILRVMQTLDQGRAGHPPGTTTLWGGFVGTGGSGLILHRTLLPILASTLRLHALIDSPFPPSAARRPADIIIQDCLLGTDPLCPTTSSYKNPWLAPRQSTMVITSRLVMDHIGGHASTSKGRVYDSNKWRCGWRHPFHGRPEVIVVPV